jgi:DNA-binding response OmpR family regulator
MTDPTASAAPAAWGASRASPHHPDASPRRIVVGEDERDIAEPIALHLSELPARVTLANDGLSGRDLAPREFDLLRHFVRHPGRVFTRTELLDEVWGPSHDRCDHTVNSHINRLRSKPGDERADADFIHTVWGVGDRFEATE